MLYLCISDRITYKYKSVLSFAARRTIICRPSNDRSTGGKRLFDGRKSPDEAASAARFNQEKRPIELGHCPVAVG